MAAPAKWFKGNLHTHTTNSDGDSPLEEVAEWYRSRGYHFVAVTDHDRRTDPEDINRRYAGEFLVIPAEEVTANYRGEPIHINGIGVERSIAPVFEDSAIATLEANTAAIRAQGAVASWNHPQSGWAVSAEEFLVAEGPELFEIFNGGHRFDPLLPGHPPAEEAWDRWLNAGKRIWAIATDDMHRLQVWSEHYPNPGRGWVQVEAPELTEEAILAGLRAGHFYASTGVDLVVVRRDGGLLEVEAAVPDAAVRFIGRGGQDLHTAAEPRASYSLQPGDGYVRAVVELPDGRRAWTQAIFERD